MFRRASAILLFACITGLGVPAALAQAPGGFVTVEPPQALPLFQFQNEKGRGMDMKDLAGRYVLLNFWATSCAPCVAEMPDLNALSKKIPDAKLSVIAISEDHDAPAAVRLFFGRHDIDHLEVYSDPSGRAPFILHLHGIPTTILVDPHGNEVARLEGPAEWNNDAMINYLTARLQP